MNKSLKDRIFNLTSNEEFEDLCLELFEYQIKHNSIYSKYAKIILQDKKPKTSTEIPFLPIEFFKTQKIISCEKQIDKIFKSSGTEGERSCHYVADLKLYQDSFSLCFNKFYGDPKQYTILALLPSYLESKQSSLVYMVDSLIKISNSSASNFYNKNIDKLAKDIYVLEKEKRKILLIGVSYALLDFVEKYPMNLQHTTILETGGMKGKRREITKEEMHNILKYAFNIENIHSEYGMTELLSQAYSNGNGIFKTPAWMKILIRDIHDPLTIIGNKKRGGINIIDLANIYSCPFIATQDLGEKINDSTFYLLGRYDNADTRGCNLLIQ